MKTFEARIREILDELGVPADFPSLRLLPLHAEASELVRCEPDMFGREQQMTRETEIDWRAMRDAARADGVELLLVSAFRSVEYQAGLIRAKLAKGQAIEDILTVNAAPGYSEHHSGRALDLATPGQEPLVEAFEETSAFRWLKENAGRFNFSLSYPRGNPYGIVYEPWHWANYQR